MKKWTQLDLRICKSKSGSKRSKNNKSVSQGEHWYKILQNCQMVDLGERPNFNPIISRTKCDRARIDLDVT